MSWQHANENSQQLQSECQHVAHHVHTEITVRHLKAGSNNPRCGNPGSPQPGSRSITWHPNSAKKHLVQFAGRRPVRAFHFPFKRNSSQTKRTSPRMPCEQSLLHEGPQIVLQRARLEYHRCSLQHNPVHGSGRLRFNDLSSNNH